MSDDRYIKYCKRIERKTRKDYRHMTGYERTEKRRELMHIYNCIGTDEELTLDESQRLWHIIDDDIAYWDKIEEQLKDERATRLELLHNMHNIVLHLNNENAYYNNWIVYGMPDEPTEDDFEYIADNLDEFKDITTAFYKVVASYGKDGFWY